MHFGRIHDIPYVRQWVGLYKIIYVFLFKIVYVRTREDDMCVYGWDDERELGRMRYGVIRIRMSRMSI